MSLLFGFCIFLLLLQSLISLRGGRGYLAYVRGEVQKNRVPFTPFATIFAPCRGLDQGLRENLAALSRQDYPAYEVVFVTDSAADESLAVIAAVRRGFPDVPSRVVIAGAATDAGQKVHNLRAAVLQAAPQSEVFVLVDSDARPRADWLRSLVAPLADEKVGAASGYRWFVPVRGGLASHLRAVWNASIVTALGANGMRNFCWGGATALRRATFERLNMREKWRGTLSDDFALTHALHADGLPIYFVPQCLTASHEDCSWRGLVEFTTRQIKITRVYAPKLWQIVLFSNLLFALVFYGGGVWAAWQAGSGKSFWALGLSLLALYALGSLKAYWRWQAVRFLLGREVGAGQWAHLWLWPLTSALYVYNGLAAAFSRRIVWRGIAYRLDSPQNTVIESRSCADNSWK